MHMHDHSHHSSASRNLALAFLLNLIFTLFEAAGGYWTGSIAVLTDALHDAGDCLSLGIAWYLQRISARRPDARFTYGYRRFSSLGALVTGVVLSVGLAVVVWHAGARLQDPTSVHAAGMLGIAAIGLLVNGAAAFALHGGASLNERVASWHLWEDTLGWAAVLVGSVVMLIWDAPIIDPILSLLIACFVLWNVVRNLKRVGLVFLQSAPPHFNRDEFHHRLTEIPGVVGAHHTHTWTLDGERHVFSTHLTMQRECPREVITHAKARVHQLLRDLEFEHITLEVELEGETCGAAPCGDPTAEHTPP